MGQDELLGLIERAAADGRKELDLSGQGLTEIPAEIGKLTQLETLSLWRNQISKIPEYITNLSNLTILNLGDNQISEIPECITNLSDLTELYLGGTQISEIPDCITNLSNLTRLDLSGNQISKIPESIANLSNLTELNLGSNQISEIPESITTLTNLTRLYLYSNQISEIPESITNLTNLNELYLGGTQISEIPESITTLTNLTELNLAGTQISAIPDCITNLSNLTELYLAGTQIIAIPECITNLSNLTTLNLVGTQISAIPDCITTLTNLTRLYLYSTQISEIPECITNLTNLTELYLGGNQISAIPDCITNLSNLTRLDLNGNQISEIPESLSHLSNLTTLYLGGNQISAIPDCITNLSNLTELYLNGNQISEIPESLSHLSNLTRLDLWNNQISAIPDCITNLSNLTELYLNGNQISEIPESLSHLSNLTRLDLWNNQISQIPEWLGNLPKLERLDLRRNPLPISPEILGSSDLNNYPGSVADIFNYLHQMRSGHVRPLNEAKLLLVGQGSVGKTSLIERLLHNRYDPNQPQTDGLNVEPWQVRVNSKDVRLNVWDFGGQEIYHATHQFFLTKRSLYLLVCNCRTSEEENRIEYWLKLIASFGGASPVIIVGNKKDEQPFDINRKALREKYPNIQAIIETSCQDNLGIDELRKAIYSEVGKLKEVYDLLPLPWFEVKEHLEAMTQDFISYNQYLNICNQKQISEEQSQEQLIDLLHRLGLVLNFREHPILQNTNVLKPDWVTAGIYTLLSDETLKTENKGIFTPADLSRILDPQRYPEQRHQYLIELMKEFELCFALDCHPPRFLIPGLLPKDEPEDTGLEGETLEFQYHYQVLPQSIISRFIVLTHEKIHNQTYWRSGVMLEDKEGQEVFNIARIKADPEDKKIFITISGREQTRRSFLKTIRDVFKKIHSTFTNPEITEWVPVPHHPDHPPLDYQELLGLEEMKVQEYPIGKLKTTINIRQLLDGYEDINSRQRSRRGDRFDKDFEIEDEMGLNIHIHDRRSKTIINQNGEGDNFGGDRVSRDKIG